MKLRFHALWSLIFFLVVACSTSGHFVLPPGSQLEVNGTVHEVDSQGVAVMRPFFWTSASGVPYRVLKDGQPIQEGKLRTSFRVVSIFWPPYAIIYWPMGLNGGLLYDMVEGTQEPRPGGE